MLRPIYPFRRHRGPKKRKLHEPLPLFIRLSHCDPKRAYVHVVSSAGRAFALPEWAFICYYRRHYRRTGQRPVSR